MNHALATLAASSSLLWTAGGCPAQGAQWPFTLENRSIANADHVMANFNYVYGIASTAIPLTNDTSVNSQGVKFLRDILIANSANAQPSVADATAVMSIDGFDNYLHIGSYPGLSSTGPGCGIRLAVGSAPNTPVTAMSIEPNGRVGIGTTSPYSSLHVAGGVIATGGVPGSNGVGNVGYAFLGGPPGSEGDNDSGLYSTTTDSCSLYANNIERLRVDPSGVRVTTGKLTLQEVNAGRLEFDDSYFKLYKQGRELRLGIGIGPSTTQPTAFAIGYFTSSGTWTPVWSVNSNSLVANPSDERVKHDVRNLSGALESLLRLRGVSFYYNDPDRLGLPKGMKRGFIAQDVEKVFPEWVGEQDGIKSVGISGFEALAVESLRELRDGLAGLRAENGVLREENVALRQRLDAVESMRQELASLKAAVSAMAKK